MRNFTSILFVVLSFMGHPAPGSAEATSFCLPVDPEMLERHLQRPAGKPAALLNAGEPRTVRMIYFLSDPQRFRQEVVDKMKTTVREVQRIYADQIRAHGFGETTFRYEMDAQGEPMVHVVYGTGGNYHYADALGRIQGEYGYDLGSNIYFIVLGNEEDIQLRNVLGLGLQTSRNSGWAMLTQYFDPNFVTRAAHELGHAFGLWHNFNDGAYIMSYGPGQGSFSELSAGHLAVHPHFNSDSSTKQEYVLDLPTCEILSSRSYRTGATSVPIQLELSDPDGLQQVSLFVTTPETHFSAGSPELKTGRLLGGVMNAAVDLQYDGIPPSDPGAASLSTLLTHKMAIEVVDLRGNIRRIGLSLLHESTHKLVIPLDRQKGNGANGVAFSPDGKILASASGNLTVELWNAETGAHIATLEGYDPHRGYIKQVFSLAFSPDGKILATGTWHGSIKLWDVATRTEITTFTLSAYRSRIMSLAFSPDGKILASGITDDWTGPNIIRLWDMATKTQLPPLVGHTHGVQSVTFSPDGKTLASGSFDSTIRLWDVATKTEIAKIPYENSVTSVSFSPDGKTLVSSAFNGKVAFWDVGKRAFKDQFLVRSVNLLRYASFTLDGGRIVTASQDGDIKIWEVDLDAKTYRRIARLQGNSGDQLLGAGATFSPDGTTFATSLGSGYERGGDYTIVLWDLSPYVTPVVHVADFNLKAAIREALGKSGYGPLTRADVERLTTLDLRNREIRDLTGLEWATQLTHLNLEGNPLASRAANTHLPALEARGVEVLFPRSPQALAKLSGDGQQAPSGTPVEDPLIVEVQDQNGVGLPGSAVTFAVIRGEGALSVETATTDAQGRAATTLTPLMAGTVSVEVTVEGLEPVIFTAGGHLIPKMLTKLSGDEQRGRGSAALAEPLVVEVVDQNGNVLEGVQVTFAITAGDGTLSVETATTDAQGRAAATLTLGEVGEGISVEVTVEGLEPVIFTARRQLIPQTLAKLSGDEQQGLAGAALTEPFVVQVLDQNGNVIEEVQVAFAITAGDGTLSVEIATTDAQGRAATTLTLGEVGGDISVEVTVEGLEPVIFTGGGQLIPQTLTKLSGDEQQGLAGAELPEPLVVEVLDQSGNVLEGVRVVFAVTTGAGILSVELAITDSLGQAASPLMPLTGEISVEVTVEGLEPVIFTAVGQASPDFDGDGQVGFGDFFLFVDYFGTSEPHFDLDGDGQVGFGDFFLFVEHFGQPARAKLMALARERIGLPDGPQLQQNTPNPFNSQTVLSYFLLRPGLARLEVFALTGQRVGVLHQGPKKAGLHRLRWDGRDDRGRPLASGVYVYRLVTGDGVQTRKLTLLR